MRRTSLDFGEYISMIEKSPLFEGFHECDIQNALSASKAVVLDCDSKDVVFFEGEIIDKICLVLRGQVDAVHNDFWGNYVLLGRFLPMQTFADSSIILEAAPPYMAIAESKASVLVLSYTSLRQAFDDDGKLCKRLLNNLWAISEQKSIALVRRISLLTIPKVHERMLSFLSYEAEKAGSNTFILPYNHSELASYLCMNRTTLSVVLTRLVDEGIISYDKNTFKLQRTGDPL